LLHLTGGGYGNTLTLNLAKTDEANFRAQVENLARQGRAQAENLTRQAQRSNATRALEQAVSRVEGLTKTMTAVSTQLPAELAKFAPIEQRYRTITELMRGAVSRQQSIYGGDRAFVARSQIANAVNQAGGEADQLHASVQSSYADFDVKASASIREVAELRQSCGTASTAVEETKGLRSY